MAKTIAEKFVDIFVSTIARDMSKSAVKAFKDKFQDVKKSRGKVRRRESENQGTDPEENLE